MWIFRFVNEKRIFRNVLCQLRKTTMATTENSVKEGKAIILPNPDCPNEVFYNPVQEFNRDISIAAIKQFSDDQGGLNILEALSATGLRAIRYAKEIPSVANVTANDFSKRAVAAIERNIKLNDVGDKVVASHGDASEIMARHRAKEKRFDVVDLDPYGSPTPFLDGAVQCVVDGGLLCVTCTDMAVLCGNASETCYTKYGAVSLRSKCCHEMALRIVLQCIEAHANRYGRYIEPLLSLSIDFYVRVFVRINTSQKKCKETTSKLGYAYQCTGCESITTQPLGLLKVDGKNNKKYVLPGGPPVQTKCKFCDHGHHMGGPFWLGPLHQQDFVERLGQSLVEEDYGTFQRMEGMLAVVSEELPDVPFYYMQDRLCTHVRERIGKMINFRSALLNAGYRVSLSHANKAALKTDAPNEFIWDMMRAWAQKAGGSDRKEPLSSNSVASIIMSRGPMTEKEVDFTEHPKANPPSRSSQLTRFQMNPLPNWGPKMKAKGSAANSDSDKRAKNQGKYTKNKRALSDGDDDVETSKRSHLAK